MVNNSLQSQYIILVILQYQLFTAIMNIKIIDLEFEPLIPSEAIRARTKAIAKQLSKDYQDKNPIFVGVLNGCFMFMADLLRKTTILGGVVFTNLFPYQGGETSPRRIRDDLDLIVDITNRHIV